MELLLSLESIMPADQIADLYDFCQTSATTLNHIYLKRSNKERLNIFEQMIVNNISECDYDYRNADIYKLTTIEVIISIRSAFYSLKYLSTLRERNISNIIITTPSYNFKLPNKDFTRSSYFQLPPVEEIAKCRQGPHGELNIEIFFNQIIRMILITQDLSLFNFHSVFYPDVDSLDNLTFEERNILDDLRVLYSKNHFNFELGSLNYPAPTKQDIKHLSSITCRFLIPDEDSTNKLIDYYKDKNVFISATETDDQALSIANRLTHIQCLDLESNLLYNTELLNINHILISIEKEEEPEDFIKEISFVEALDSNLCNKIDILSTSNNDKYLYCLCDDSFINNKIVEFIAKITGNNLIPITKHSLNSKFDYSSDYLRIDDFSTLDYNQRKELWNRFSTSTFRNGFAAFIDCKTPDSKNNKALIPQSHIWNFQDDLINKHISKILYSLITEHLKANHNIELKITMQMWKAIENNLFAFVLDDIHCDFDVLDDVIKTATQINKVNLYSPQFWYNLKYQYLTELEKSYDTQLGVKNIIPVQFIYDEEKDQWEIYGIADYTISLENNKQLICAILAIFTHKIHITHAMTISNYFWKEPEADTKLYRRIYLNEIDLHNDNSSISQHLAKLKDYKSKQNIETKLVDFFNKVLELRENHIVFKEIDSKTGIRYKCKIVHPAFTRYNKIFYNSSYENVLKEYLNNKKITI